MVEYSMKYNEPKVDHAVHNKSLSIEMQVTFFWVDITELYFRLKSRHLASTLNKQGLGFEKHPIILTVEVS